ncbi:IS110 family transposase [Marivirga arenosa]|uniref:IS110 family transposase n=1 Tax=Marivirga arenosa TaxID=3059076 RepID=A0AA49JAS2_9BACT|nr:IS110 family transposase [Marivirga sp. ABR2-2]WKK84074.2 IS110 family transposase [Marivirga sp. ABR2-2]
MDLQLIRQSVGIDIAMNDFKVCYGYMTTKMDQELVAESSFENTVRGMEGFLAWLADFVHSAENLYFVMEATGVYHERLCHYLNNQGLNVSVMPSGRVKKYAQSLKQRSKTDLLDAKMLCNLGLERKLDLWVAPSQELLELKQMSRERGQLVKEQSALKCKLHALEHGFLDKSKVIKRLRERLQLLAVQIQEVEMEMRALIAKSHQLKRKVDQLTSIPGISLLSAVVVIGETLGFHGIKNAKQLTSYTGYDVVHRESGLYRGKTSISKRGNSHIRAMLHMPSMTAVRCNPTLKPFYERLKTKKSKPIIALVAVQRKLLCLMFTLWNTDTKYDADYQKKSAEALAPA